MQLIVADDMARAEMAERYRMLGFGISEMNRIIGEAYDSVAKI